MTKDELIALRRERGKQELNIGDRVKVYDQDGEALYSGKAFEIIGKSKYNSGFIYSLHGLMSPFTAELLELVKEPTDEIKVGDRVVAHIGEDMDWIGTVQKIIPDTDGLYGENLLRIRVDEGCLLEHRVSRCTKIEPEKENDIDIHKEADDPIKDIADIMEEYRKGFAKITSELVDFDWQQYRTELASKIAVAYAEKGRYKPSEIGEFAVMVANDVVDNLKKEV